MPGLGVTPAPSAADRSCVPCGARDGPIATPEGVTCEACYSDAK